MWRVAAQSGNGPGTHRPYRGIAGYRRPLRRGLPSKRFGGVGAYVDLETKAAVLCWHLIKKQVQTLGGAVVSHPDRVHPSGQ